MATAVVQKEKQAVAVKTASPEDWFESTFKAFDAISRRAFEIFDGNGRLDGHDVEHWFQAEKELFHPVRLEITETDDSISVKAEVPGFTEKDLQVIMQANRLTISGKRESSKEEKKGKTTYSETSSNEIFRVVDLPAEVDADKVTATLKDGVLQLNMPKTAVARTVPVKTEAAA